MDSSYAIAAASAFLVAWLATGALIRLLRAKMLDVPNARSSHTQPTPRGGGLGVVAGFVVGSAVWGALGGSPVPWPIPAAALAMAALGFADDRFQLSSSLRLAIQLLAAAFVVALLGGIGHVPAPAPLDQVSLGWLDVPLTVVWIVGVINLYNFLDGIDGFAAGQGAVAGIVLAFLFAGSSVSAFLLILAGACAGFLVHNWNPASVFLGDVGSCFLGAAFAIAPLALPSAERPVAVLAVALALWLFLADGAWTLLGRAWRGEKIWEAHRSHIYQRLTQTGLTHAQTVLIAALFLTPILFSVVWSHTSGGGARWWLALGVALASFVCYFLTMLRRERSSSLATAASKAPVASAGESS